MEWQSYTTASTMSDEALEKFKAETDNEFISLVHSAKAWKTLWPAYTFACGVVVGMLIVVLLSGGPQ